MLVDDRVFQLKGVGDMGDGHIRISSTCTRKEKSADARQQKKNGQKKRPILFEKRDASGIERSHLLGCRRPELHFVQVIDELPTSQLGQRTNYLFAGAIKNVIHPGALNKIQRFRAA